MWPISVAAAAPSAKRSEHAAHQQHRLVGVAPYPTLHGCNSLDASPSLVSRVAGGDLAATGRGHAESVQLVQTLPAPTNPPIDGTYLSLLDERDELKRKVDALAARLGDGDAPAAPQSSVPTVESSTSGNSGASATRPTTEDEEALEEAAATGRLLTDGYGVARYMGDSSGPAFYSALMEVLLLVLPPGRPIAVPHAPTSYHTLDSQPLPLSNSSPFILPPLQLTRSLVSVFFQHCADVFHFVAPVAFNADVDAMYASGGTFQPQGPDELWRLAQLYLVLALAMLHAGGGPPNVDEYEGYAIPGIDFFGRSLVLIGGFSEHSGLDAVQALALAAYYLLCVAHRNTAYAYIGAAMRTAISLGMHRIANEGDEHTPLVFWTVYILDRLISSILGRPVQVMDDEICTPKPHSPSPSNRAAGLAAHVRIAELQTGIVRDLYVTSSKDKTQRLFSVSVAARLCAAATALQSDLRQHNLGFHNPRGELILKLACNQTINVICRHALLHALRMRWKEGSEHAFDLLADSPGNRSAGRELESNLARMCMEAVATALDSAHLMEILYRAGMCLPWCFFDTHCAYNAGVVLLLSKLVDLSPPPEISTEVATVKNVLTLLIAGGNESAQSCKSILDTMSLAIEQANTLFHQPDNTRKLPSVAPETANEWVELLQSLGMSV